MNTRSISCSFRPGAALAVALAAAGCGAPPPAGTAGAASGHVGSVSAAVQSVPKNIACMVFDLSGSTVANQPFTVQGPSPNFDLGNVNPGALTVRASAFTQACNGLNEQSVPAYQSDATTFNISVGLVTSITLTLRPVVHLGGTVDIVRVARWISSYNGTSFAILLGSNTVAAWGNNDSGQLGDGSWTDSPTPEDVPGWGKVQYIGAGTGFACALDLGGSAWCAGTNNNGQLGDGTQTPHLAPALVNMPDGINFTQMSVGDSFVCAVGSDHRRYCWGNNANGQLGYNPNLIVTRLLAPAAPVVADPITPITVTSGYLGACATSQHAAVWCWGSELYGEFGDGALNRLTRAAPSATGYRPAGSFVLAGSQSFMLDEAGGVWGAGQGSYGELGIGFKSSNSPAKLPLATATGIATAGSHSCALLADGTVSCWGYSGEGALGDGMTGITASPVKVRGLAGATQVTAGGSSACALLGNGSVRCWGGNDHGALGDGSREDSWVPVRVKL